MKYNNHCKWVYTSGSMDAANMLKPALSRGDIQVIGADYVGRI
jgi:ATP-dependent Clp protease ATP-binding subunit ClpA